jgi:hypothetical protein
MPERTKRGEEDRKREDEEVKGEPVEHADQAGERAATVTRDKGIEPSEDSRRDGRGEERK